MTTDSNIVGIDIGTSSVRALLFDDKFSPLENVGLQKKYELATKVDGSVEVNPYLLLQLTAECLDALHAHMADRGLKAAGVAMSTFWHCFLGVDRDGRSTTPIVHLFDTRSLDQMDELIRIFDPGWIHAITGCMPHTSYWPAKLLWLKENHAHAFSRTARLYSPGEFVMKTFCGQELESTSMISATGIWDHRKNDYCEELLEALGISRDHLAAVESLDSPCRSLLPHFAERWPLLNGIPWYPALGDGACNSIGSGCTTPKRFALMVGTTGAMRVVVKQRNVTIPAGIWCYRVNRERFILGGATSNGGEIFRWASRLLHLPSNAEEQIASREPGSHGLTVLPYLAGERSPYWRPDLRGSIAGLSLSTSPVDILQACLESVSLRFRQIYMLLSRPFSMPDEVIASGGALLRSKVWLQMMADALGHTAIECLEPEASSRGAAIIIAEQMGLLATMDELPVNLGETMAPKPGHADIYARLLNADGALFDSLYGTNSAYRSVSSEQHR
ncbi:MAG: gluconokinase [Bryobacteraceae bacterium]